MDTDLRTFLIVLVIPLAASLMLFASCSPKVTSYEMSYDTLNQFSTTGDSLVAEHWWKSFNDPQLNTLIDSALTGNLSLQAVFYQLEQAKSAVKISSSNLWPDVDLQLRSGISRPRPDFVGGENTQLSLQAGYEVDLWGRIRHSVKADEYRLKASYYDYKTAALSLSAEIVTTWLRIKSAKNQLDLIQEQLETNEKVLALIRARFQGGQVRGVDILRQKQLIEASHEDKLLLEASIAVLSNQLSVLLGHTPGVSFDTISASLPELPPTPETGIPVALINRRPDLLASFNRLQAADRELAVSISNKYPRFNLSLIGAIRSNTYADLFQSQAASLTAGILAPIFYGGRLNAQVDQSEAQRQQQLNNYGQTVLNAFQEVENALIREVKQQDRLEVVANRVELAEKTYQQLRIEYLNGLSPYLDVLLALNQLQQLRRSLILAKQSLLENRVTLYRALAGDFNTAANSQLNNEL